MAAVEIEATDVIRLMLQFLKEQSLTGAMQALQEESQVALNTVDNVDSFLADVQQGRWDAVMPVVATLRLPFPLLADVYELLVLELIELRELERQLDGGRAQQARAARARAAPAPSEGQWGALRQSVHRGSSDGEMLNQIYLRRTLTMQIVL